MIDSIVVSELLLLGIFVLFVRSMENRHGRGHRRAGIKTNRHPFSSVGILGRAYVAFVVVTLVTDSMTLGGWLATFPLWRQGDGAAATAAGIGTKYAAAGYGWWSSSLPLPAPMLSIWSVLVFLRFAFWVLSISLVCCALDDGNGGCSDDNHNNNNNNNNESSGIWTHVFGWSVVGPCKSLGTKVLATTTTMSTWKQQRTDNSNGNGNVALVTTGGGNHTSASTSASSSSSSSSGTKHPDRREISARRAKLFSARSTSSTTATGIKINSSTRTSNNTTAANRVTTNKNTIEKPRSSSTSASDDASSLV